MAEPPSSPPNAQTSVKDELAWYKAQYEHLEHELSEFQTSSKELEAELERDLESADKRERVLQERAEALSFELEGWKRKFKESKAEANAAQNALEREITTLRNSTRTLQHKLRDIEVANDDFERQARNTTSSLEDLESKYNVAIERAVLMEEELRSGDQEREQLRVEAQRLREELSDLKIEAEILQDKVRKQESRHLSTISTDISLPASPTFEASPNSTASSPLITTPPDTKAIPTASLADDTLDPPSPPMSDASVPLPRARVAKTPVPTARNTRLVSADNSVTPKPNMFTSSTSSARAPKTRIATTSNALRTPTSRPSHATTTKPTRTVSHKPATSNSLAQVRSLTAKMQRLEARVQSVRSKLPAPIVTPPHASPRSSIIVPSTVTIRSRKRTVGSTNPEEAARAPQSLGFNSSLNSSTTKQHVPRLSTSGVSRLSFGPLPNRKPPAGGFESESSRPSSRASISSYARPASRTDSASGIMAPPRPVSRTGFGGARTPMGRPRSSLGGSLHGHGSSLSYGTSEVDESESRTPSRRGMYSRLEAEAGASGIPVPGSGIPMPSSSRRQSGGASLGGASRRSSSAATGKLCDLSETY